MSSHIILVGRGGHGTQPPGRLRSMADALRRRTAAPASVAFLDGGEPALPQALDAAATAGATAITLVPVPVPADPVHARWTERVAAHWAGQRHQAPALSVLRLRGDDPTLTGALAELATAAAGPLRPDVGAMTDPAWDRVPQYRHHVLVCRGPRCSARGAGQTAAALTDALAAHGLGDDDVLVAQTGCLYPCNHGPIVVVHPSAKWYGPVGPALAEQLVDQHLAHGDPVVAAQLPLASDNT
jgi:(2Fe-2S) ferredoxin